MIKSSSVTRENDSYRTVLFCVVVYYAVQGGSNFGFRSSFKINGFLLNVLVPPFIMLNKVAVAFVSM